MNPSACQNERSLGLGGLAGGVGSALAGARTFRTVGFRGAVGATGAALLGFRGVGTGPEASSGPGFVGGASGGLWGAVLETVTGVPHVRSGCTAGRTK